MDDVVIKPYRLVCLIYPPLPPLLAASMLRLTYQDDLLQKIENLTRIRAASKVHSASPMPIEGEVEMTDS